MKTRLVQLVSWSSLLAALCACSSKAPDAESVALIETAIPNGLVPGSALTLKGRDFGAVQSVQFANVNVAASNFIRTATNEVTLKVPANAQAGAVQVIGEKGPGQPKQMVLLTGSSGLTADNVSTNVNTITQGYFSDSCSPRWFTYCMRGSCLVFYNGYTGVSQPYSDCSRYNFTTEQTAGATFNVYKNNALTMKCELNKTGGFTGFVVLETLDGNVYFGSMLKNGNVVSYSTNGNKLELCKAAVTGTSSGSIVYGSPCVATTCTSCP